MSEYQGLSTWVVYLWALMDEIWGFLFDLNTGAIEFSRVGDGQWILTSMNLPDMTTKGKDIVAAMMTVIHNGAVFLAEISTLLPSNALSG